MDMDNQDTGRHTLALSEQTEIPGTRTFGLAAPVLADFGHERRRAAAADRNVAFISHVGTGSATVPPDRLSRGRQGWPIRSPPESRAAVGARLKEPPLAVKTPARAIRQAPSRLGS